MPLWYFNHEVEIGCAIDYPLNINFCPWQTGIRIVTRPTKAFGFQISGVLNSGASPQLESWNNGLWETRAVD